MSAAASASSPPSRRPAELGLTFLDRLAARIEATRTNLCLGIDPDPSALPAGFESGVQGVERMARLLIDHAAPHAAAVKINIAFFEAFGSAGIAALERVRVHVASDIPLIIDAKRADLGTTAARQVAAIFDGLAADAVTLNPYLGADALAPFITRADRFAYILCRTSNPGAGELQNLDVNGEPLYIHVARRAAAWSDSGNIGLVVGATAPDEMGHLRQAVPELPFLVPGVGAQGGDVEAVRHAGPASAGVAGQVRGGALLINVSRAIADGALAEGEDPAAAVSASSARWAARLQC